ncbi:response regulator [Methylomonas sp. AM2-LC]|uniref:response regulator n=1 Tax=Methylomonas sp. AM2-LC TaxID=3153301 RepID=UPI003264E7E9
MTGIQAYEAEFQEMYQTVFDNCHFGLIIVDHNGKIISWNPWLTKHSLLNRADVQGKTMLEVFPLLTSGNLLRAINLTLSHGMSSIVSHALNTKPLPLFTLDGQKLHQQVIVKPLKIKNSHHFCLIQINDITAAVKREKQLLESIAEFTYQKFALDQHAIVAVTDVRGTITYVNDQFCRISQYSKEELMGQNHRLLNSGTHPKEFFTSMYRAITRGEVWQGDICNRAKDNSLYWVATTIVPYMNDKGKPTRYIAIRADITERKRAEEEAKAATLAKSQFLANMSHEIRTPMNAIIGLTSQVMESELNSEQRDQLNKVKNSGKALVRIINDILDFSKIESDKMTLERVPIRLESLLLEAVDLFGAQVEEKGLEMFVEINPDTPLYFLGDPLRLSQVLTNLIGNAVKFTQRGEIHVAVKLLTLNDISMVLEFSVRDTGLGINTEQIDLLFKPFTQADSSTTRKFGGSGLGLSIAKKLVELMGGQIWIETPLPVGTCIKFTVKMANVPSEIGNLTDFSKDLHDMQGKSVLVVDDQATSRSILSRLLEAWGLIAIEAETGHEALAILTEASQKGDSFYAVLLDWRMPDIDGIQVATQLKNLINEKIVNPPVRVLMVTAYEKLLLLEYPHARIVDQILTKPVAPSNLFNALRSGDNSDNSLNRIRTDLSIRQNFAGIQVLLVEDHDINQEVAANFLKKCGVTVTVAWHGAEAVDLVKNRHFHLVLMDLHMPIMGGIEATRLIRALANTQHLPIVAMTAAVMHEDRKQCMDVGMNDFISKPIEPEELIRVLKQHVQLKLHEVLQPEQQSSQGLLDLTSGLRRLDGDSHLQQRLLLSFIERNTDFLLRLNKLLQENNIDQALDLVHALKGIAANLGAVGLTDACRRITEELRLSNTLTSLAYFEQVILETMKQIQRYLVSTKGVISDQASGFQTLSLAELLLAVEPFIVGQEIPSDEIIFNLNQLTNSHLPCLPLLNKLLYHLENFEYKAALDTFKTLKALVVSPQ